MYAVCVEFDVFFQVFKAAKPLIFATVLMPKQEREALEKQARETARQFGISESRWLKWRAGYGARRDFLMVVDPVREVARIREKEKASAKEKAGRERERWNERC